jgi:uncharacterized phage protein (TIGR02218 family)
MPVPSTPILEALQANCTFVLGDPIIKITSRGGTIAAYAPHTRYITIDGQLYSPYYPVDAARPSAKVGLQPDSGEFVAPFDDVITSADIKAKVWRGARVYTAYAILNQLGVLVGVVQEREWFVGRVKPRGSMFTMELLSKSQALRQQIGAVTSPIDRNRTPEQLGVNMASFTHAATVTGVTNRRVFTTGVVQADVGGVPWFMYGRAEWLTGNNADLSMEIETNATGVITLQLPMPADIQIGDTLNLIAGYDGTREQARDKFNAAEAMDCEPDLPGLQKVLTYPA